MAMRDPKEWAADVIRIGAKKPIMLLVPRPLGGPRPSIDAVAALIREAQEDGVRHATCPHCGPGTDLNTALNQLGDDRIAVGWAKESITRLEAQVAALTERAERAEGERTQLLHRSRKTLAALHRNVMARRNAPGRCCDWSCDLCAPLMKLAEDDA